MQSTADEVQPYLSHAILISKQPKRRHITRLTQTPMPSGASDQQMQRRPSCPVWLQRNTAQLKARHHCQCCCAWARRALTQAEER